MVKSVIPPSPSADDYAKAHDANADEAIFGRDDPMGLFVEWLAEARRTEPNDPNAMALATSGADGLPDCRMVLLKNVDPAGFVFYSNAESAKGLQLAVNAQAALLFHWKSLRRQVRVRGPVEPVTPEEADAYFAERARDSRIGAWASDQSRPLEGRFELERRIARYAAKYLTGDVPRPPQWTGWRIRPLQMEFWRDRPFRLHDRLQFTREGLDRPWTRRRLYP
ncbi:pyridoxamine 5'-phosphate oxidase [Brevundimonas sp. 2R-24]|uniref:Pyridoxine/pyridoxamine 5'-phosphate oxidase n=1 Tax=Peiella sedimenti TaxID=3061083 RepID=A0ABT8SMH7_9CAUL|nr:pyridoxamine 5'-phosphate oxidase [Caulobacteraceae bacterium XZ-24]